MAYNNLKNPIVFIRWINQLEMSNPLDFRTQ